MGFTLRHIKTEFGVNDGFIEDEIYSNIESTYHSYYDRLQSLEELTKAKETTLPIGKDNYVYFLFDDNVLVYIGQTVRILARVQDHMENKKQFNSVSLLKTDKKDLLTLESFYIYKYKPKYNRVGDKSCANSYTKLRGAEDFIRNLVRISV